MLRICETKEYIYAKIFCETFARLSVKKSKIFIFIQNHIFSYFQNHSFQVFLVKKNMYIYKSKKKLAYNRYVRQQLGARGGGVKALADSSAKNASFLLRAPLEGRSRMAIQQKCISLCVSLCDYSWLSVLCMFLFVCLSLSVCMCFCVHPLLCVCVCVCLYLVFMPCLYICICVHASLSDCFCMFVFMPYRLSFVYV